MRRIKHANFHVGSDLFGGVVDHVYFAQDKVFPMWAKCDIVPGAVQEKRDRAGRRVYPGERFSSDHNPILLKLTSMGWDPTSIAPFPPKKTGLRGLLAKIPGF